MIQTLVSNFHAYIECVGVHVSLWTVVKRQTAEKRVGSPSFDVFTGPSIFPDTNVSTDRGGAWFPQLAHSTRVLHRWLLPARLPNTLRGVQKNRLYENIAPVRTPQAAAGKVGEPYARTPEIYYVFCTGTKNLGSVFSPEQTLKT